MRRKPGKVYLDPQHPLAKKLVLAAMGHGPRNNTWIDSSQSALHGQLTNMSAATDVLYDGTLGRWVIDTDGDNDYVPFGDVKESKTTMTAACWVKRDVAATGNEYFLGRYWSDSNERSWSLRTVGAPGDDVGILISQDGYLATQYEYITKNGVIGTTWCHVGFTFDNGDLKLYVNGTDVGAGDDSGGAGTTALKDNSNDVNLGATQTPSSHASLQYADVMIWSRVLTPPEMRTIAQRDNHNLSGLILTDDEFELPPLVLSGGASSSALLQMMKMDQFNGGVIA